MLISARAALIITTDCLYVANAAEEQQYREVDELHDGEINGSRRRIETQDHDYVSQHTSAGESSANRGNLAIQDVCLVIIVL